MIRTHRSETTAKDMTEGAILPQLVLFTLPLLLGNIFQMLYNTVDTLVVGNYVSTQALADGSFFSGVSRISSPSARATGDVVSVSREVPATRKTRRRE